jgi:hypothetical protein
MPASEQAVRALIKRRGKAEDTPVSILMLHAGTKDAIV